MLLHRSWILKASSKCIVDYWKLPVFLYSTSLKDRKIEITDDRFYFRASQKEYELGTAEKKHGMSEFAPGPDDWKFINVMYKILRGGSISWWEAAAILKKYPVQLKPFHVRELLKKNLDGDAAFGLFRWAESLPKYEHNIVTYNAMLWTLGYNQNFNKVDELLKEMEMKKIEKTFVTYMIIVENYFDAGVFDKGLKAFSEFEQHAKPQPKKKYYVYVITKLANACMWKEVSEVFERMIAVGHKPNTDTYNFLIKSYCWTNRMRSAIKLSKRMIVESCPPDHLTYVYLMGGLVRARAKSMSSLDKIIQEMIAHNCKPNMYTFQLLLDDIFAKKSRFQRALKLVEKLVEAGVQLDTQSQRILGKAIKQYREGKAGVKFFKVVEKYGVYPDRAQYNTLLEILNKENMVNLAWKLFEQMKGDGCCPPDAFSYNIAVHLLCKKKKVDEALQMFEELKASFKPNRETYDVLIMGLLNDGRLDWSMKIYHEMYRRGCTPDQETYKALISRFKRLDDETVVKKLTGRMQLEQKVIESELRKIRTIKLTTDPERTRFSPFVPAIILDPTTKCRILDPSDSSEDVSSASEADDNDSSTTSASDVCDEEDGSDVAEVASDSGEGDGDGDSP